MHMKFPSHSTEKLGRALIDFVITIAFRILLGLISRGNSAIYEISYEGRSEIECSCVYAQISDKSGFE